MDTYGFFHVDNSEFEKSAVLGALGSTMTTSSANSQTLLWGLLIAAVAKTLPSLKDEPKSWEDWILLVFAILGAFAVLLEAQSSLRSMYPYLPILLLLIGILGKTLLPLKTGGRKGWKMEDKLTAIIAIIMLAILPFAPQYATIGVFFAFLTKTLTSTPTSTSKQS